MDAREVTGHLKKAGYEDDNLIHMLHAFEAAMEDVATKDDIARLEEDFGRLEKSTNESIGRLEKDIGRLESSIKSSRAWMGVGFSALAFLITAIEIFG